ncbi:unnamed protein product [Nippostrongylus brasiliensis]|uniref:Col_cuticle_N domain-containing protein n=1 Tax=Nippostrongylus brasiliensis TaxID=27835 RepID=A0A0N4YIC2_NIPBR|nr:unnamed protein product [Nippostrongylus brasiliensis]
MEVVDNYRLLRGLRIQRITTAVRDGWRMIIKETRVRKLDLQCPMASEMVKLHTCEIVLAGAVCTTSIVAVVPLSLLITSQFYLFCHQRTPVLDQFTLKRMPSNG